MKVVWALRSVSKSFPRRGTGHLESWQLYDVQPPRRGSSERSGGAASLTSESREVAWG